jgi:hypothetical protein
MKKKILSAAALVLLVLCAGFTYQTARSQFEYKFENGVTEKKANELGADGWELVAVLPAGAGRVVPEYIFKRAR